MEWTTPMVLGLTTFIPVATGILRYSAIKDKYYPFLYFIWLGGLVDLLHYALMSNGIYNTTISSNIYILIASIFILYFFYRVKSVIITEKYFQLLSITFLFAWLFESFIYRHINDIGSYYRILFSFVFVLISITSINHLLTSYPGKLLRNSLFFICVGFVFYFTLKILLEVFWLYGLDASKEFRVQTFRIMSFVDAITNLIYFLAILWIPKKQASMQPF